MQMGLNWDEKSQRCNVSKDFAYIGSIIPHLDGEYVVYVHADRRIRGVVHASEESALDALLDMTKKDA